MGFPLSTFQHLAGLCRDEYGVRESFSRYKAVAVVVHDPDDRGFKRTMKYAFERLHETTGPDFAFITFIDPPQNWKRAHMDWMEIRERLSAGDGCDDPAFFRALQDRLDLPDSPCLVITDDLLSERYAVLPTSEDRFVGQLEAVGRFAAAQERRFPADGPEFTSFLESVGTVWTERTADGRSLAANIADLVAVPAMTGRGAARDRMARSSQMRDAEAHVREALRTLRRDLESVRGRDDGDEDREGAGDRALGRLSDYLALIAGAAGTRTLVRPYGPAARSRAAGWRTETDSWSRETDGYAISRGDCLGMERFSRDCLMNYNRLLPLYFDPDRVWKESRVPLYHLTDGSLLTDYSPLGNFLGKAVEEEVNASLVQQLRGMLGVSMPEFYRLWREDLDMSGPPFSQNGKLKRFNQKGRPAGSDVFEDRTVAMGDTVYATRYLRDRCGQGQALGLFGDEPFLDNLYWFARGRDTACHNSLFGEEAFADMHRRFMDILYGYLPRMVSLKRRLRARAD